MKQARRSRTPGRSSAFRGGEVRVAVLGLSSRGRRRAMTKRETKQWAAAKWFWYLGLLLGVAVGLVLFAIAFWPG
jgi:hypothetical protein